MGRRIPVFDQHGKFVESFDLDDARCVWERYGLYSDNQELVQELFRFPDARYVWREVPMASYDEPGKGELLTAVEAVERLSIGANEIPDEVLDDADRERPEPKRSGPFVDDLERFRRVVVGMADAIRKWRALVNPHAPPHNISDLTRRFDPNWKWDGPDRRYFDPAIEGHNKLWTAWQQLSPELLPAVRAAQAPRLVEWVYCPWPDSDDPRPPTRTRLFQSYTDAIGHATEHRHFLLAILSHGARVKDGTSWRDSSRGGFELECAALDIKAVYGVREAWLAAPLWNRYDEMDLDWLALLIEQEFVAARQKAAGHSAQQCPPTVKPTNRQAEPPPTEAAVEAKAVEAANIGRIPILDDDGSYIRSFAPEADARLVWQHKNGCWVESLYRLHKPTRHGRFVHCTTKMEHGGATSGVFMGRSPVDAVEWVCNRHGTPSGDLLQEADDWRRTALTISSFFVDDDGADSSPQESNANSQAGPPVTEAPPTVVKAVKFPMPTTDTLRLSRIERLHEHCLEAAAEYPTLYHVAMRSDDLETARQIRVWPDPSKNPAGHAPADLFESAGVIDSFGLRPAESFWHQWQETHSLQIRGQTWKGGLTDPSWHVDGQWLGECNTPGILNFLRLAEDCVAEFGPADPPSISWEGWRPHEPLIAWLETIYAILSFKAIPLSHMYDPGGASVVHTEIWLAGVPGNVFNASARTIQALCLDRPKAQPTMTETPPIGVAVEAPATVAATFNPAPASNAAIKREQPLERWALASQRSTFEGGVAPDATFRPFTDSEAAEWMADALAAPKTGTGESSAAFQTKQAEPSATEAPPTEAAVKALAGDAATVDSATASKGAVKPDEVKTKSVAWKGENDGPVPPRSFMLGDKHVDDLPRLPYKLLDYLWHQDRYLAKKRNVSMALWDDEEAQSTRLPSLMSRTNERLSANGVPATVEPCGDYVRLVMERP